jgi:hypothetical protein
MVDSLPTKRHGSDRHSQSHQDAPDAQQHHLPTSKKRRFLHFERWRLGSWAIVRLAFEDGKTGTASSRSALLRLTRTTRAACLSQSGTRDALRKMGIYIARARVLVCDRLASNAVRRRPCSVITAASQRARLVSLSSANREVFPENEVTKPLACL